MDEPRQIALLKPNLSIFTSTPGGTVHSEFP